MICRPRRSLLLSLGFILATVIPVFAGEPEQLIKQTTDKILSILSNPDLKGPDKASERRKRFSQALEDRFDWEELSRRSLARHWSERTPEEKKEFVPLYRDLLERTYLEKVDDYSGETVQYEGEVVDGEYATVKVKIRTKNKREIPVEYRMLKKANTWWVYDLSIEGVSLVNNYRQQFNSMLQKSTFQEVLKKLREKSSFEKP